MEPKTDLQRAIERLTDDAEMAKYKAQMQEQMTWAKINNGARRREPIDDHVEAPKDYGNW